MCAHESTGRQSRHWYEQVTEQPRFAHRHGLRGLANANASAVKLTRPATSAALTVFSFEPLEPFRNTFPALTVAYKYSRLLSHLWGISSRQLT